MGLDNATTYTSPSVDADATQPDTSTQSNNTESTITPEQTTSKLLKNATSFDITTPINVTNNANTSNTNSPTTIIITQSPTTTTTTIRTTRTTNTENSKTTKITTTNATTINAVSNTSMVSKNGSAIILPSATVTAVSSKTTVHPGSSGEIGGIDQNLFIIGSILCGLILIVTIAFIILCARRKRRKKKILKRIPPSTLTFSGITNGNGMIDSPSSATINISERIELIQEGHSNSRGEGGVSIQNDGVVAYHKEDEYIAVWAVDEYMEQQQQEPRQQQMQHRDTTETQEEKDNKNVISNSNQHPTSPLASSNLDFENNICSNFKLADPSSTDYGPNSNRQPEQCPTPTPDYDLEQSIDHSDNPVTSTGKNQRPHDLRLELIATSSDADTEILYENHNASPMSPVGKYPSLDSSDIPTTQTETRTRLPPYINGGYEGDMAENPDGIAKTHAKQDTTSATVISGANEISIHTKKDTNSSSKPSIQTLIASENYYEEDDPEPDYDGYPPMLSRDSGIGADQDNDGNYDVPADLFNQIRKKHNVIKQENKRNESDYYMSPSTNKEENPSEIPEYLNYENTKINRPETYLYSDDLELKSPTDEDELLKLYDNFSFKSRKASFGKDDNTCLYETPEELHQLYEVPSSLIAIVQHPSLPGRSTRLHKLLSSSLPVRMDPKENEREFLMKSISRESETESEYHQPGDSPEPTMPKTTNENISSPESNYINSPDNLYVNSAASDMHDFETDEVEYHTPNDISHSPFFQNIDKNKLKMGSRSLPPAFKPPPPRLKKATHLGIGNNNVLPPTSGDNRSRNQPTKTPVNVKSLTLGNSPRLGMTKDVHDFSASQKSLNDIHESEDDPSNVYLVPRSSVKDINQGLNALEKTEISDINESDSDNGTENGKRAGTRENHSKQPNESKVDMNELQNVMKKRGLHNL